MIQEAGFWLNWHLSKPLIVKTIGNFFNGRGIGFIELAALSTSFALSPIPFYPSNPNSNWADL
jgi:hypothetical protein